MRLVVLSVFLGCYFIAPALCADGGNFLCDFCPFFVSLFHLIARIKNRKELSHFFPLKKIRLFGRSQVCNGIDIEMLALLTRFHILFFIQISRFNKCIYFYIIQFQKFCFVLFSAFSYERSDLINGKSSYLTYPLYKFLFLVTVGYV